MKIDVIAFEKCKAPLKPTSRVRLLETIAQHGYYTSAPTLAAPDARYSKASLKDMLLLTKFLDMAEWFDFGTVNPDDIRECAMEAIPFVREDLFRMPFPQTVFRARFTTTGKMLIRGDQNTEFASIYKPDEVVEAETVLAIEQDPDDLEGIFIQVLRIADLDGKYVTMVADSDNESDTIRKLTVWPMLGMWLMLNTKNIRRKVVEPDVKLNKARAKSGKIAIKRSVHIDAGHYITALNETIRHENTGGGKTSRASPRMHLRRAHLRHYSDHVTAIHAMIINGADEGSMPKRETYRLAQ